MWMIPDNFPRIKGKYLGSQSGMGSFFLIFKFWKLVDCWEWVDSMLEFNQDIVKVVPVPPSLPQFLGGGCFHCTISIQLLWLQQHSYPLWLYGCVKLTWNPTERLSFFHLLSCMSCKSPVLECTFLRLQYTRDFVTCFVHLCYQIVVEVCLSPLQT